MGNYKDVKLRKDRECGWCGATMKSGEMAVYYEGRNSSETESELSKGKVSYFKCWVHPFDVLCQLAEPERTQCLNGNHSWVEEHESDGYVGCHRVGLPTGKFYCEHCGTPKPIES